MTDDAVLLTAVFVVLVVYFLPTIIAVSTHHVNALAIFFLNLFAGWTGVGWLGALIWSVLK